MTARAADGIGGPMRVPPSRSRAAGLEGCPGTRQAMALGRRGARGRLYRATIAASHRRITQRDCNRLRDDERSLSDVVASDGEVDEGFLMLHCLLTRFTFPSTFSSRT